MFRNRDLWRSWIVGTFVCWIVYYYFASRKSTHVINEHATTFTDAILVLSVLGLVVAVNEFYHYQKSYLYRKGIPGTATIIKVYQTGISISRGNTKWIWQNQIPQYEMVLDVNDGEGSSYRAYTTKFIRPGDPIPQADTLVKVKIHPKDKYKMVID